MPLLFPVQKMTKLGQFRVKDESPSSGHSLQPGSLFFSRDSATKSSTPPKGKAFNLDLIIRVLFLFLLLLFLLLLIAAFECCLKMW